MSAEYNINSSIAKECAEYGNIIRAGRKKLKKKLVVFSKQIGVSVSYLSAIERGKRRPLSKNKTQVIALSLGLSKEDSERLVELSGTIRPNVNESVATVGKPLIELMNFLIDMKKEKKIGFVQIQKIFEFARNLEDEEFWST